MTFNTYTNELKFVLSDVIDWLKFAEAKHVGLITFNSAILAISFDQLSNTFFKEFEILLYIIILFNILSILISIISFIPQSMEMKLFKILKNFALKDCTHSKENLLFYKDICNYDSNLYLESFIKKYKINLDDSTYINPSKFDLDICNQIVSISKLCTYKYYLFNLGIKVLFIPLLLLILSIIIA